MMKKFKLNLSDFTIGIEFPNPFKFKINKKDLKEIKL